MRTLLLLTCLASLGACKKKAPEQAEQKPIASVDQRLQVVLVTPSSVPAQATHPIQIVGTAFQPGAEVRIGEAWVSGVDFENANTLRLTTPALPDGRYDVTVQTSDGGSATLWAGLVVGSGGAGVTAVDQPCSSVVVYFALDSDALDASALGALEQMTGCFQTWPGAFRIEGHADERGTTDYNVSLGARRAESVRRHLHRQGVALHQMRTTSFGEERPAVASSDEAAWAKNRRVEVQPVQ